MTNAIELTGVVAEVEGHRRLSGVTLSAAMGECVVFMGASRSGHSLMVELCAGLIAPERGTVRVLDHEWTRLSAEEEVNLRLRIGTVLQRPGLLSNMTLYNNVALPLRYHGVSLGDSEIDRLVGDQLRPLGLEQVRDQFPSHLHPGEARCAAIARALVLEPELLLLDDPADGLDAEMAARLGRHLGEIRRTRQMTLVMTLRAPSPLAELADRIIEMQAGPVPAIAADSAVAGRPTAVGISSERIRSQTTRTSQPS